MPTDPQKAIQYYRRAASAHAEAVTAHDEVDKELNRRIRDQLLHLARSSQQADEIEKLIAGNVRSSKDSLSE